MLLYLSKITVVLSVALLVYKLLLENSLAHHFKRYYLLVVLVMSLILPLITISVPMGTSIVNDTLIEFSETIVVTPHTSELMLFEAKNILIVIYGIGVFVNLIFLVVDIYKIERLKRQGTIIEFEGIRIVLLDKLSNAFSFWKYVYMPLSQELTLTNKVLLHEKTHIVQYHTLDILFIEILKVVFWFHPLFYYYKTCIALNHEFLADKGCITTKEETNAYLKLLLTQTCKSIKMKTVSSFNFHLTKKRFAMITKNSKPMYNIIAIVLSIVLFFGISLFSINILAVTSPYKIVSSEEIYTATDIPVTYKGGINQFVEDFISRFDVPKQIDNISADNAMIVVQFTVKSDGSLEDINVLRDPLDMGHQVISILEDLPHWSPAIYNGEQVSSRFTLPIKFKMTNNDILQH